MAAMENLNKNIKIEKDKLKEMSFKDKCWYIWEYYKFYIIGTAIALFLIISIGSAMYSNRFDTAMSCVVINSRYTEETVKEDYFQKGFRDYLGLDENTVISIDNTMSFDLKDTSQYGFAALAKITAMVSSKSIDVMIADDVAINHYSTLGGFADLKEVLPADLYDLVKEDLIYATDEAGTSRPYAVSLEDTNFVSDTGMTLSPPLFSILSNTTHIDNCVALLRYIVQP